MAEVDKRAVMHRQDERHAHGGRKKIDVRREEQIQRTGQVLDVRKAKKAEARIHDFARHPNGDEAKFFLCPLAG